MFVQSNRTFRLHAHSEGEKYHYIYGLCCVFNDDRSILNGLNMSYMSVRHIFEVQQHQQQTAGARESEKNTHIHICKAYGYLCALLFVILYLLFSFFFLPFLCRSPSLKSFSVCFFCLVLCRQVSCSLLFGIDVNGNNIIIILMHSSTVYRFR